MWWQRKVNSLIKVMVNRPKGVWGTIQVPFNADESIDYSLLDEQIRYLATTSLHGVYSNGTAAEFFNQTEEEFDRIHVMMAEQCSAVGMPFQIGASHMSPMLSLARLKRTKPLNPAAFQVIFPDWLPLSKTEQYSFLARLIEAADPIPLVLYMPGHAKNQVSLVELHELALEFPGLVGVKIGYVKPEDYDAASKLNQQLSVFIPGHHMATGLSAGIGVGSYSNMACINSDATRCWYDAILADTALGLALEKSIQQFFNQEIIPLASQGYSDPALDKLLAAIGGKLPGNPALRWPYRGVDDRHIAAIREVGKRMLPEFFD